MWWIPRCVNKDLPHWSTLWAAPMAMLWFRSRAKSAPEKHAERQANTHLLAYRGAGLGLPITPLGDSRRGSVRRGDSLEMKGGGAHEAPRYHCKELVLQKVGWVTSGTCTFGGMVGWKGVMPKSSHQRGLARC